MTARDWVLLVGALALASLVPVVWAIVDVTRRPPWQFSTARKVVWALTLGLGWLILWPLSLVSSVVYLAVIRRRFPSVSAGPPRSPGPFGYSSQGPFGYPPQGPPPAPPAPPAPPLPPPGWYADPAGSDQERWWDGRDWTDHLR